MTLEQKIGQLLFVGISDSELSLDERKHLEALMPGGIILFKRNIQTLRGLKDLTKNLRTLSYQYSQLPLLIGADQEGGNVNRVPMSPRPPSALALGEARSPALTKTAAEAVGSYLKNLGVNLNLAPVLDATLEQGSTFIGSRGFSSKYQVIAEQAVAYAEGLIKSGVMPIAKHFPGSPVDSTDPHTDLVFVDSTVDNLKKSTLIPFVELFKIKPLGVMSGHTIYPNIDSSRRPASSSKPLMTDLLRKDLKFEGLVITDDLNMAGSGGSTNSAIESLISGADMLLIAYSPKNQSRIKEQIKEAIRQNRLTVEEVDQKLLRILRAKAFVNTSVPTPNEFSIDPLNKAEGRLSVVQEKLIDRLIDDPSLQNYLQQLREPGLSEALCVFSTSEAVAHSFVAGLRTDMRSLAITSTPESDLKFDYSLCKSAIIFYTNRKTIAFYQKKIPLSLKSRTLIINLGQPVDKTTVDSFQFQINAYTNLKLLPIALAQKL